MAMERLFEGEIVRKRQIKFNHSQLVYVLDSSLTILDEVLQQTLAQNTSEKMRSIVTTIQREQNRIIRNDTAYNVIVQGAAGSGKTAIALHRIAYFLYKFRNTLSAEHIYILSPNKVFGDYISSVLPELGEEPVRSFTLDELTKDLLSPEFTFTSFGDELKELLSDPTGALATRAKVKGNDRFVEMLQEYLYSLDPKMLKHESITIDGMTFPAKELQRRFLHDRKEPVLTRLERMAEDILQALRARGAAGGKFPGKNEIMKRLRKLLQYTKSIEIYRSFMESLGEGLFKFENNHFEFQDVYPYLYVELYFKGIGKFQSVQHLVVDEMQDYTPIQYAVLSRVFECRRTMIGDFSQALYPFPAISKDSFEAIFSKQRTEYVELTTTYRSTYEIAMYAQKFMRKGTLQQIARHGQAPREMTYITVEQMVEYIRDLVNTKSKTTAIICKTERDMRTLQNHMDFPFAILDGRTEKLKTGTTILTTVQYAKGLEFDAVIVPFVNAANYHTDFDRGLLYIAVTRAMHELTILVDAGSPSPLL